MQEALHVNKDSALITSFVLLFMPLIQLLVAGFNDYYNEYLGKLDKGNEC
jgi:hypothetical protein